MTETSFEDERRLALFHAISTPHVCDPGASCSWYHGVRPLLRLLDIVVSADRHMEFYEYGLGRVRREHPQAISALVLGEADFATSWAIVNSAHAADWIESLTVADLCHTPLNHVMRFCSNGGIPLSAKQFDLMGQTLGRTFNLIVSDSLVTRFPASEQVAALCNVRRLLPEGGFLITTIRDRQIEAGIGLDEGSDWSTFIHNGMARLTKLPGADQAINESLAFTMISEYAKRQQSMPLAASVEGLFATANLSIEYIEAKVIEGEPGKAMYHRILARAV